MIFFFYFFIVLFFLLSLVLGMLVLIQESKSMGLTSSFGSDGSSSLFGSSTPVVLKKLTAILGAFFLSSCLILSVWSSLLSPTPTEPRPLSIESVDSYDD